MACLARTRARDTRVSEFLVAPLFILVAPLSVLVAPENSFACTGRTVLVAPGGNCSVGFAIRPSPKIQPRPHAKTSQALGHFSAAHFFKKAASFFKKAAHFFSRAARFFSKTTCFGRSSCRPPFTYFPPLTPLRCNQKSAHARDACVRARKSLIIVTIKKRSCKTLSGLVTDPTPAPSPTREGSCCRLVRRWGNSVGPPLPCRGGAGGGVSD